MMLSPLNIQGGCGIPNLTSNDCELQASLCIHSLMVIEQPGRRLTTVATDNQLARVVLRQPNRLGWLRQVT